MHHRIFRSSLGWHFECTQSCWIDGMGYAICWAQGYATNYIIDDEKSTYINSEKQWGYTFIIVLQIDNISHVGRPVYFSAVKFYVDFTLQRKLGAQYVDIQAAAFPSLSALRLFHWLCCRHCYGLFTLTRYFTGILYCWAAPPQHLFKYARHRVMPFVPGLFSFEYYRPPYRCRRTWRDFIPLQHGRPLRGQFIWRASYTIPPAQFPHFYVADITWRDARSPLKISPHTGATSRHFR